MKTEASTCNPSPIDTIRLTARDKRKSLTDASRQILDQKIQTQVQRWVNRRSPTSIALFLPFDGEPNLLPIVNFLRTQRIQLALPVVNFSQQGQMQFHLWTEHSELLANRFGIKEPVNTQQINIPDIIFAPLVAFSSTGTRLGMGGGYYDRWLAAADPCPQIAGIAYELQRLENLPRRDWDIPLSMIFTEKGRFSFAKQGQ